MKRSTAITRKPLAPKASEQFSSEGHPEFIEGRHERERKLSILRQAQRNNFQSWISPMKRCLVLLVVLVGVSTVAEAQSFQQIMKKVGQKYRDAKSYSMSVRCDVFGPTADLLQTVGGKMKKNKRGYYSDFNNVKTICNSRCVLQVDEVNKSIVYGKGQENAEPSEMAVEEQLEQLSALDAKVTQTSKGYEIMLTEKHKTYYEKIELHIAGDFSLRKVIYHYSSPEQTGVSKSEVTFYDVRFNEIIPEHQFSEYRFIQSVSGTIKPSGKYKTYEIIDLSKKQIPSL